MRSIVPLVGLVGLLAAGCMPEEVPPNKVKEQGTCNDNGTCEPNLAEDCNSCPGDCSCCYGDTQSATDVESPEAALGPSDGQSAKLSGKGELKLTVGREIRNEPGADFMLVGQVLSDSSITIGANGCREGFLQGAGYRVEVSQDGDNWFEVGFWVKSSGQAGGKGMEFDIGCASEAPNAAKYVRLRPVTEAASAELDALDAAAYFCVE